MRYYFTRRFFGSSTKVDESCEIASLSFSVLGWREVDGNPKDTWFEPHVITKFKSRGTKSGRNYLSKGGIMQRYISKMIVAYKPVLHIKISQQAIGGCPFIFDRGQFTQVKSSNVFESYKMKIECRAQVPQVIGMRTKTFNPISVALPSTHYQSACQNA